MPNSQTPAIASREIRVFLSSTFRDMDAERTYLLKQIFPRVRAACLARLVGFSEIDLRWGVSEEEAKSGATVEICLKEIDRCRDFPPFFIGFLGERYGWVPVHEDLSAYWEENKESPYASPIQQAIARGISVTELEMELAVLQDGASEKIAGHALFCLRDAAFTDELYAQAKQENANLRELDFYDAGHGKLQSLKQRIRQSGFLAQDNYTSVEQFGQAVETYLLAQLDRYFPADAVPTAQERSNAAHAGFRFHRLTNFLPRPDVREHMVAEIARRADLSALGPILVTGPSGQGKSALMADLAQHYQTQLNQAWRVIDHYVGADVATTLDGWVDRILQTLHPEIKDLAGEMPTTQADKVKALSTWVALAAQRHHCKYLLILDALDQLSDGGNSLDLLKPETMGPDGIVIASAAHGTPAIAAAAHWQTCIEVPALTTELRTRFVSDTLARYRKRLPDELAQQLANAPQCGSPLFLGLALEELRLDARHESLNTLVDEILGRADAQQLFLNNFLLDADYGRPEEPELAARFMALIGAARAGLSEQELSDLLALPDDPIAEDTGKPRLPQIHLSRLLVNMSPFLLNKQGRRAPMHRIFGEAAMLHQNAALVRNHLYNYFAPGYGYDDQAFDARAATEALHQIAELARLEHPDKQQAKEQLMEDLGRLDTLVALHDDEANQAGTLVLDALGLLSQQEHESLASSWQIAIEDIDAECIDETFNGLREFGDWLDYWANYVLALAVLLPLHTQQKALQKTEDESFANTCDSLGTLYLTLAQFDLALPLLQKALAICEKILGSEHLYTATALNSLANLLMATGDYAGSEPIYRRALVIREKALGAEHPDTATSLNYLAKLLSANGDYAGAEPIYRRALVIREKALGAEHPDTATSLKNLANLLTATGDHAGLEPLIRRALAISEKALGTEHPNTANSLNSLAVLLHATGDYAGAEPLFQRVLFIVEKNLGAEHPTAATVLNNLAILRQDSGDYAGAEQLYRRSLAIHEKALGTDHPDTASSLNNLASLLKDIGDYTGAEPLYRRALAIREKALAAEHPDTAISLNNLAELLDITGDYAGAEPLYRRALVISEKALGAEHPLTATSLNNLAGLLEETGDYTGAETLLRRALTIWEKALGAEHPDTATGLDNLAGLLVATGDYTGAEPLYRRALEITEKVFGGGHIRTAESLINFAHFLNASSDYDGAEQLLRRALEIREKNSGAEHLDTARCIKNLSIILKNKNALLPAELMSRRALSIVEKAPESGPSIIANYLDNLGEILCSANKYENAIPVYIRSLKISKKYFGINHKESFDRFIQLASTYQKCERYNEAENYFRRALSISRRCNGREHETTANCLLNLAELFETQDRYDLAISFNKRVFLIRSKCLAVSHPDMMEARTNLIFNIYKEDKAEDYLQLESIYKKYIKRTEKEVGRISHDVADLYQEYAGILYKSGNLKKSLKMLKKAIDIYKGIMDSDHEIIVNLEKKYTELKILIS